MNGAHWHLVFNHLPIIAPIIGVIIFIAGFVLKNTMVKRVALAVFVLAALFAIPAFMTGEDAKDIVKKMPEITKNIIRPHSHVAKTFLILIEILGGLALITLMAELNALLNIVYIRYMYVLVFAFSVVVCVFAQKVGTSGGEIRHTEIREGAAVDTTRGKGH